MGNQTSGKPEISGKVVAILPTFTGASGFTKRDIVIETGLRYPNPIKVTFKRERTALLDDIAEGDSVAIRYALDGREWDGPRGKQWFVDVVGLEIENAGGGAANVKPVMGATKEGAVEVWLRAHPDKGIAEFGEFCKRLKPGLASKDYKIADWADVVNEINGVKAKAAANAQPDEGADADDPNDLPF